MKTMTQEDIMASSDGHALIFQSIPGHNDLRIAAAAVLTRPYPVTGYRFIAQSPDRLAYLIEEVDVGATLKRTTIPVSRDSWTVPVTVTCRHCSTQYRGWKVVARKWEDSKPVNLSTEYCPACPLVSTEAWLAEMGIQMERPPDVPVAPRRQYAGRPTMTIREEDYDDFE